MRDLQLVLRILGSALLGTGIVSVLMLGRRVLKAARYAVMAVETKEPTKISESTLKMHTFITLLAILTVIAMMSAVTVLIVALTTGRSFYLYPVAAMVVYPYFVYAAWHRTPCFSCNPDSKTYATSAQTIEWLQPDLPSEPVDGEEESFKYDSFKVIGRRHFR
eukprot:CAMPEP_0167745396 /NCGR_PEP_ID=MMETSP0110_2-20121227/3128_1 /TAXON_ID=629695 /ORGANISM="Gymnochlora sp., Strain CCMP2014" /LENGTH=162 /DNA_ID=CAMNT_0007630033 /DNA_START=540 /DNA_END=1024 /DNA_ORIENTATION=+